MSFCRGKLVYVLSSCAPRINFQSAVHVLGSGFQIVYSRLRDFKQKGRTVLLFWESAFLKPLPCFVWQSRGTRMPLQPPTSKSPWNIHRFRIFKRASFVTRWTFRGTFTKNYARAAHCTKLFRRESRFVNRFLGCWECLRRHHETLWIFISELNFYHIRYHRLDRYGNGSELYWKASFVRCKTYFSRHYNLLHVSTIVFNEPTTPYVKYEEISSLGGQPDIT